MEEKSNASKALPCPPFFLNVLLLNKDEVVTKGVQEKTGAGFLGKVAAFAANKIVTDEKIITNLSTTLMETIKKSIEEMGIHIEVTKRFQQGPLVVLQFQVVDLELMKVLGAVKGQDFLTHFQNLLAASNHIGIEETILAKIYEKIYAALNDGMIKKFGELLPAKMKEKGVLVDCQACTHHEQALVFYELMDRLPSI